MKKITTKILVIVTLALSLLGCHEQIFINGKYYDMLNENEYNAMIQFARLTLTSESNKLDDKYKFFIKNNPPTIVIDYRGDKSGYASYEWTYENEGIFRIVCEGKFLTDTMNVRVRTHKFEKTNTTRSGKESSGTFTL